MNDGASPGPQRRRAEADNRQAASSRSKNDR